MIDLETKSDKELSDVDNYVLGIRGVDGYHKTLDQFKEKGEQFSKEKDGYRLDFCESQSCNHGREPQKLMISMLMGLEVLWLCESCIAGMESFAEGFVESSREINPDGKPIFLFGVTRSPG